MRRVKYNRGNLDSTLKAAKKVFNGTPLYIFATAGGYTIDTRKPPFNLPYKVVTN